MAEPNRAGARLVAAGSASIQYVLAYGVALPVFALHKLIRRTRRRPPPPPPGSP
jgi:hypothetical protein